LPHPKISAKDVMFPHRTFQKFTWKSPDGKTHHILIDRLRHSSVPDVPSFRAAGCNSHHYVVMAEVKERLTMIKKECTDFVWRGSVSRN
jgi:hypothetical protein